MLKGIEKINKILENAFKDFEIDFDLGSDFEYDTVNAVVYYTLIVEDTGGTIFLNNFNEMLNGKTTNIFMASLLHEIGHHMTYIYLTDKEVNACIKAKNQIIKDLDKENANIEELMQRYFNLVDEYEATAWAVEYYTENEAKMCYLWEIINKALQEFYELNNIVE